MAETDTFEKKTCGMIEMYWFIITKRTSARHNKFRFCNYHFSFYRKYLNSLLNMIIMETEKNSVIRFDVSPILRMLHMKFGFDWPSCFRVFSIRCNTEVTPTCGALLMTRQR